MASVPMAMVLVAAVVVPLAVIPGSFGYQAWPSSHGDRISETRVQASPRTIEVVLDRPARTGIRTATTKRSFVATRNSGAKRFPTVTAPAPVRHQSGTRFVASAPPTHVSEQGRGPGDGAHGSHTPSPGTPSVPASESEPPAGGQTGGDQVASGDSSVLRGDQPATPVAPPSPVQPVAPVPVAPAPVAPAPASQGRGCDGDDDQGDEGDGHSDQGRGRHLGLGHRDR